jgi:hypothetical protein
MLKNDNMPRDSRRSLANKNSMWYDLNICNKTWENAIKSLLSDVNSCKVNFKTKLQSLSICASAIEQQQLIPLKDLHTIYVKEYKKEYLYNELTLSNITAEEAEKIYNLMSDLMFITGVLADDSCFSGFNKNHIQFAICALKKCPSLIYKSSDFRDLCMKYLPVILVYKRVEEINIKSFIVKKKMRVLIGQSWLRN